MIGGQVGIAQHLSIGDNVRIAAKSGVMNDLARNCTYGGYPATEILNFHRQTLFLRNQSGKETPTDLKDTCFNLEPVRRQSPTDPSAFSDERTIFYVYTSLGCNHGLLGRILTARSTLSASEASVS